MIAEKLKQFFDPYVCLDTQIWENFSKLGEVKLFEKETVLKEANFTEKYINILLNGSGGNLIWNKNNFVCVDIAFENEFLCDYMSFTLQKPTAIQVRLFDDATVFRVSHQSFQQTLTSGALGEKISRLVSDSAFIDKQQQQIDLLTKTAKERYIDLLQNKKGIGNIPLKYLASYLGITPQSLSRIRAEKI